MTADTSAAADGYVIGVMTMQVEGRHEGRLARRVEAATRRFEDAVVEALGVRVDLLTFDGPHLTPVSGAPGGGGGGAGGAGGSGYDAMDFLRLGMTEKLERGVHFLLIVTEVDLAASVFSVTPGLPSPLTNVAILSTKRLDPAFWGEADDEQQVAADLSTLLQHQLGHLLNLPHDPDPANVMYDFPSVDALAGMTRLTDDQRQRMRDALPREAHERAGTAAGWRGRLGFIIETLWRDRRNITGAVRRANPVALLTRLPTMITAALSVLIVLFFSPEMWDVASTVELYQLLLFSLLAVLSATAALHRGFAFRTTALFHGRPHPRSRNRPRNRPRNSSAANPDADSPPTGGVGGASGGGVGSPSGGGGGGGGGGGDEGGRVVAESTVVTAAATLLSVLLTMVLLLGIFVALAWLGVVTIFPHKLMETWPTVDPAVRSLDHVKLSLFVASLGLLAGSLGGRADRHALVRAVLFLDEAI